MQNVSSDEVQTETASGDGPVAAVYEAIDRITGLKGKLIDYTVRSITAGTDAVGEVFVHVEFDGTSYTGKAASTDVVRWKRAGISQCCEQGNLRARKKAGHRVAGR
jgi:2-isopropylmalate synthase